MPAVIPGPGPVPNDTPGLLVKPRLIDTLPAFPQITRSMPTTVLLPSGPALVVATPPPSRAEIAACGPVVVTRSIPFPIRGGIARAIPSVVPASGLATTVPQFTAGSMRASLMANDSPPWLQDDSGDDGAEALLAMTTTVAEPAPVAKSSIGTIVPLGGAALGFKVAGVKGAIAGFLLGKLFGKEG